MAGKIVAQIIIQGAAVFSKAFVSAYHQALQSKYAPTQPTHHTAHAYSLHTT
jgi:hypothetical protein